MKEPLAAKIGFLVALIVPALSLGLLTPIIYGKPDWQTIIGLFPIGYLFSTLLALPLAVPAYLFAKRRKLIFGWSAVITGLVIGAVVAVWVQGYVTSSVLVWSVVGGLAGFVFWLVWKHHEPKS